MYNVTIVGAGIIGLSTAYYINQHFPHINLTVVADKFSPNTTSDVAAGFWEPHYLGDTNKALQRKWAKETYDYLLTIYASEDASTAGVTLVSGYEVFEEPFEVPFWAEDVIGFRLVYEKEINRLFPGSGYKYGLFFTTVICESQKYLPYLTKKLLKGGCKFIEKKLDSFNDLDKYPPADVIINCCGYGARELNNDKSVRPVRGQIFVVQNPGLKHFFGIGELQNYILHLSENTIVVGGTHQMDDDDLQFRQSDADTIWENCCKFAPQLKGAKIESSKVGLRPYRSVVRLEDEICDVNGKKTLVIHSYGHGGGGITLHWGCAKEAVEHLVKGLKLNIPASRL